MADQHLISIDDLYEMNPPVQLKQVMQAMGQAFRHMQVMNVVPWRQKARFCLYHKMRFESFLRYYKRKQIDNVPYMHLTPFEEGGGGWDDCGGELGRGLYLSSLAGAIGYVSYIPGENKNQTPPDHKYVILEVDLTDFMDEMGNQVPNRAPNRATCNMLNALDRHSFFLTNKPPSANALMDYVPQIKLTNVALSSNPPIPFNVIFFEGFNIHKLLNDETFVDRLGLDGGGGSHKHKKTIKNTKKKTTTAAGKKNKAKGDALLQEARKKV